MNLEIEARAEDILPEEAVIFRLLDGCFHIFHRQGVLRSHVDIALVGTDGVSPDKQPFENGVGITFGKGAVHISAGVSLITVDNDIFGLARRLAAEFPLPAGKEAGAAATA